MTEISTLTILGICNMKTTLKKAAVVAASVLVLGSAHAQGKTLNFGIISTESSTNLKTVWMPFLNDMSKKLGMKVKPFFASDYAGIIQGMRFGKVDVAWYGNKSAMEAVDRANGEIFAQTVAADGSPGYWSLIITHKDSPLKNLKDMFAKRSQLTFGNGDPNSTSGFLVPSYYVFAMNNVDPKEFKRTLNSNHETNAISVATKKVDVATNNTESIARLKATAPQHAKNIKVLWKSPLIPSDPIVWNKKIDSGLKAKLRNFFMTYGTKNAAEKKILASLDWAPFRASNNDQLLPIRQLATFKKLRSLENDKTMSASEKAKKKAQYEAELKRLEQRMKAIKKKAA